MAGSSGPRIVSSGLVLDLDAGNMKSYPGSGTNWVDLSKNNYNASLSGAPSFSSGSIIFNGTTDMAYTSSINLSNTNAVSLAFFCKILNYPASEKVLIELSNNFNNSFYGFVITYAATQVNVVGSGLPLTITLKGNAGYNITPFSKSLVDDLQWHYWVCIFNKAISGVNPQETYLYIDGRLADPSFIPSAAYRNENTNNFSNNSLFIGARSGNVAPSNVQFGCIQMYNRVLTPEEVLQNYNATRSRFAI